MFSFFTRIVMASTFTDHDSLKTARDAWCTNSVAATTTYGHINTWDVSQVTDFSFMFCSWVPSNGYAVYRENCNANCVTFNDDISSWDVSRATTMNVCPFAPPIRTQCPRTPVQCPTHPPT